MRVFKPKYPDRKTGKRTGPAGGNRDGGSVKCLKVALTLFPSGIANLAARETLQ
jgi:hypothetical protein